ncbi:MAG: NAD-dependent epimerase/dehydratase family protein [Pseudomonadota bacterium]
MRVLVTGANGFIGGHLVERLAQAGWEVGAVQRQGTITRLAQVFPNLDLTPEQMEGYDVVYHLAGAAHARVKTSQKALDAINAGASVKLFESANQAGVQKFVYLSSIKVLGDESQTPFAEDAPFNPGDKYARSKVAAERGLRDVHERVGKTQLAIVRPPLVYGVGVGANFAQLLKWALSGWWLPLARASAPRSWVGVRNLVNFLLHVGGPQLARIDGVWHVRDEEESSVVQMIDKIVHCAEQQPRVWNLHPGAAMIGATLLGRRRTAQRLFLPLQIDMQATQAALDWHPTYRQHEELEQVVTWFKSL